MIMFKWRLWTDNYNYDLMVAESTVLMNTTDGKLYRWRTPRSVVSRFVGLYYTNPNTQLKRGDDYG
jgi:hypothetical protein